MSAGGVSESEAAEMRLAQTRSSSDAPLPAKYEAAKQALAECVSVDECSTWGKKAAAMASYARQAKDDALQNYALRIKVRAIRRCGELLSSIPAKARSGQPSERAKAADAAGMSRDQRMDALRLARIPEIEFAADVDDESKAPPAIEDLAARGTTRKPKPWLDLQGRNPEDHHRAIHTLANINELARLLSEEARTPAAIVRGMLPFQRDEALASTQHLMAWLAVFGSIAKEVK
jgi:hypothetical protein